MSDHETGHVLAGKFDEDCPECQALLSRLLANAEQKSAKSAAKAEARKAVGFEIGQTVTALDADCDERTGQIVAITRHSHIWVTIEDEHGRCDVQVNEVEEV
jgi:hypothetical protein